MAPPIASSPFLDIRVIDRALTAQPAPGAEEKVHLLSAKLYILTNPTDSASSSTDTKDELDILRVRIDLADAYTSLPWPKYNLADGELALCANALAGRWKRLSRTGAVGKEMDMLQEMRKEALSKRVEVQLALGQMGRAEQTRLQLEKLG